MPGGGTSAIRRDGKRGLVTDVSPIFLTYFMVDWEVAAQSPTDTDCISCGAKMMAVEPVTDKKGAAFGGLVCHKCKTVLWTRKA